MRIHTATNTRLLLDTARAAEALPLAQTAPATHEAASGANHPWTKDIQAEGSPSPTADRRRAPNRTPTFCVLGPCASLIPNRARGFPDFARRQMRDQCLRHPCRGLALVEELALVTAVTLGHDHAYPPPSPRPLSTRANDGRRHRGTSNPGYSDGMISVRVSLDVVRHFIDVIAPLGLGSALEALPDSLRE